MTVIPTSSPPTLAPTLNLNLNHGNTAYAMPPADYHQNSKKTYHTLEGLIKVAAVLETATKEALKDPDFDKVQPQHMFISRLTEGNAYSSAGINYCYLTARRLLLSYVRTSWLNHPGQPEYCLVFEPDLIYKKDYELPSGIQGIQGGFTSNKSNKEPIGEWGNLYRKLDLTSPTYHGVSLRFSDPQFITKLAEIIKFFLRRRIKKSK